MLRDESLYADPDVFNPDRFVTEDGRLDDNILNPDEIVYGFGRRFCPGKYLANDAIWLTIAGILATFEIHESTDSSGKPIKPSGEYTSGLVRYGID